MKLHQKVGHSIREIRKHQRMSLSHLSEASGVSKSVLSTLENGKRDVTLKTLESICLPLGLHPWELLNYTAKP